MFAELITATNYSFLRGASHPEEMVAEAIALGQAGIGIADRNSVAGVVRAHVALREAMEKATALNFRLVVGARLVFADGTPDIVAYPATRHGWGRLCRLLTLGNRRAVKGGCLLGLADLLSHLDDLLLIVLPESSFVAEENVPVSAEPAMHAPGLHRASGNVDRLRWLVKAASGRVWLGARMPYAGRDRRMLARRAALAARLGVPMIATIGFIVPSALRNDWTDRPNSSNAPTASSAGAMSRISIVFSDVPASDPLTPALANTASEAAVSWMD
jgi:error-prone DNA polymerase